jgi:glycosyltransferase involved in cell wall biosynthesis
MPVKTVDIVIPLYNKRRVIGRAIRSILGQKYSDWRLIVVDDGSTDNGSEIVQNFRDERITLIHQKNRGPGAARNTGIAHGSSEYVAFLDADDEWYPWYLENAVAALNTYDISAVSTTFYVWPEAHDTMLSFDRRGILGRHLILGHDDPIEISAVWSAMQVWNTVLSRDVFQKYHGFYEKDHCVFAEEQTFFCRVLFGEPIMITGPSAVIYHNEDSKWGARNRLHPLEPYLAEPHTVLAYCPAEKQALLEKLLALRALKRARHDLLLGNKERAIELVNKFPEATNFADDYDRYVKEKTCWWLPFWARAKWFAGPKIRSVKCKLMRKLKILPIPPSIESYSGEI